MGIYLTKAITRIKNQIAAFKRADGIKKDAKAYEPRDKLGVFVYSRQLSLLQNYEEKKSEYERQMKRIIGQHRRAKNLLAISGIGNVFALLIYCTVIEGSRFKNKYKYYGYTGLALHPRDSGKTIRGRARTHYNPTMKWVYKSAANSAIGGKNDIHDYYIFLLGKGYTERQARNEVARYIARVSLAMLTHGSRYKPYSWRRDGINR